MRNIHTSNGSFRITNALYESIKKNNPELLINENIITEAKKKKRKEKNNFTNAETTESGINKPELLRLCQDVFGNDFNFNGKKGKEEYNKYKKIYQKFNNKPELFKSTLNKTLRISNSIDNRNNEYNTNNIEDYFKSNLKKINNKEIDVNMYIKYATDFIKKAYGKYSSDELIDNTIDKYNVYLNKDPDGEIIGFNEALEKMKDDLIIVSKMIKEALEKMKNNSPDNSSPDNNSPDTGDTPDLFNGNNPTETNEDSNKG